MGGEILRNAIVEFGFGVGEIVAAEFVFPGVYGNQNDAREPGEENEAIGEVSGERVGSSSFVAQRKAEKDGNECYGHECPVQGYEVG